MLGKFVRVRITNPVGSLNRQYGYRYSLNFGSLEGRRQFDNRFAGAYIMGVHHPVRHFDGRAIAVLYREGERKGILVVAPKNMRFIGYQIADALAFAEPEGTYRLECLYERSCGAVVCRRINGEIRLLLIKNSRRAMLRCNLKLTRHMVLYKFSKECIVFILQEIIISYTRADKYLFNTRKSSDLSENIEIFLMV